MNSFNLNEWHNNPNSTGLSSTDPNNRGWLSGVGIQPMSTDQVTQNNPVMPMAHGGQVKVKGMHPIHASPQELDLLDWAQSKPVRRTFTNEHGEKVVRRLYPGIESVLRNKHLLARVMQALTEHNTRHESDDPEVHQNYAAGGPVDESNGRFGDLEVAYVGPHTLNYFKKATPSLTYNPDDGAPEFFSLGGGLSSLIHTIGGAASNAWNAAKPYAQQAWNTAKPYVGELGRSALPYATKELSGAVGKEFGPVAGELAGAGAGKVGNWLIDKIAPAPKKPLPGMDTVKEGAQDLYRGVTDPGVKNIADLVPGKDAINRGIGYGQKFYDQYNSGNALQPSAPSRPRPSAPPTSLRPEPSAPYLPTPRGNSPVVAGTGLRPTTGRVVRPPVARARKTYI